MSVGRRVVALAVVAALIAAAGCDAEAERRERQVERANETVGADAGASDGDTSAGTSTEDTSTSTEDTSTSTEDTSTSTSIEDTSTSTSIEDTSTSTSIEDTSTSDTSTSDDASAGACRIGAVEGTCRHVSACAGGEAAVEGVCAGSPQVRCCVPSLDRCSVAGVPGACLDVADCPAPDWQSTSGRCPGPAAIRCCTAVGAENACDEETLPTPNDGLVVEEPGDPGCPAGMVMVAGFCIDRYEASLVRDAEPTATLTPFAKPAVAARALSVAWAVPQGHISGTAARAACQAAGKRLCTSDEWLRACQGAAGATYPYGDTRIAGRCNDDRREHVAYEYFGTTASWVFSELDHPCLDQLPDSIDLAGENDGCVTEDGAFDMMGNRHEWVDDDAGTFRGGFFDDTSINGQGCLYRTIAHDIGHWDYSTGFRCCADAL